MLSTLIVLYPIVLKGITPGFNEHFSCSSLSSEKVSPFSTQTATLLDSKAEEIIWIMKYGAEKEDGMYVSLKSHGTPPFLRPLDIQ